MATVAAKFSVWYQAVCLTHAVERKCVCLATNVSMFGVALHAVAAVFGNL